jgi:hypothetical protein
MEAYTAAMRTRAVFHTGQAFGPADPSGAGCQCNPDGGSADVCGRRRIRYRRRAAEHHPIAGADPAAPILQMQLNVLNTAALQQCGGSDAVTAGYLLEELPFRSGTAALPQRTGSQHLFDPAANR